MVYGRDIPSESRLGDAQRFEYNNWVCRLGAQLRTFDVLFGN